MLDMILEIIAGAFSGYWGDAFILAFVTIIGYLALKHEHDGATTLGCFCEIIASAKDAASLYGASKRSQLGLFILLTPLAACKKAFEWLFYDFNRVSIIVSSFFFPFMCHSIIDNIQPYIIDATGALTDAINALSTMFYLPIFYQCPWLFK